MGGRPQRIQLFSNVLSCPSLQEILVCSLVVRQRKNTDFLQFSPSPLSFTSNIAMHHIIFSLRQVKFRCLQVFISGSPSDRQGAMNLSHAASVVRYSFFTNMQSGVFSVNGYNTFWCLAAFMAAIAFNRFFFSVVDNISIGVRRLMPDTNPPFCCQGFTGVRGEEK